MAQLKSSGSNTHLPQLKMENPSDSGSEDISSDLEEDGRSMIDLDELVALVNPPGKLASHPQKRKTVRIPIIDITVPSSSREATSYFDPFEKFNAPIQVEPEPCLEGTQIDYSIIEFNSNQGEPFACSTPLIEEIFSAKPACDEDLLSSIGQRSGVDDTHKHIQNETIAHELDAADGENRIFIESTSNNLSTSPNPGKSPSLPDENDALDIDSELRQNRIARTRNPVPDPKVWAKEQTKLNRMKGESYVGYRRKHKKSNKIMLHDTPKTARTMGPVCPPNSKCAKWANRKCHEIDESKRSILFEKFWQDMDWGQKRMFIASLVVAHDPKRKKGSDGETTPKKPPKPKDVSYAYFLKIGEEKLQVCRTTFLNTFGLKNSMVRYWLADYARIGKLPSETGVQEHPVPTDNEDVDPPNLIQEAESGEDETVPSTESENLERRRKLLLEFLLKIPKLPSHYCRQSSNRLYLQTDITSMSQLYSLYTDYCESKQAQPLSRFSFDRKCKELRLSLFTPKKDQCDLCTGFKYHNVAQEKYDRHIRLKNQAREEKNNDKILGEEGKAHVLCCDMMAVKLLPSIETSVAYYKMKLAIHNYTVYNLGSHDAICFWFTETECTLVSSVFATCLVEEIDRLLDQGEKDVIVYSDGCGYQNRNSTLSNALLSVSMRRNVLIFQKFLERGHTQMEGDSVHSVIEAACKKKDGIYLPHEMVALTKESRKLPSPYRGKMMYHSDFKDYSANLRYPSIRPGSKPTEPVVTDIRCLRYAPNGIISYKLEFNQEFQELPRRPKNIVSQKLPPLFPVPLEIPKDKWDDLQTLKTFIPRECHQYYDNLPHQKDSYKKTLGQQKKKEEKKRKLARTASTSSNKNKNKKTAKED